MIRFRNVYFPIRTVFLGLSDVMLATLIFLAAMVAWLGTINATIVLNEEQGFLKLALIVTVFAVCMYYFDLYDPMALQSQREVSARLIQVLGSMCVVLAVLYTLAPRVRMGERIVFTGTLLIGVLVPLWRALFLWCLRRPLFRERVYVLGWGERTQALVQDLRSRSDLGIEVVGWEDAMGPAVSRDDLARRLRRLRYQSVQRVIVAAADRRGTIPMRELLDLRLRGVVVEDAADLFEKQAGKIEIDTLWPSSLIFSDGFRLSQSYVFVRALASAVISFLLLVLVLPLFPFIALAIKLTSRGPVFYSQARVGGRGRIFHCYKFRTMRSDAEADTGPTWANDDDPRITRVGRFLRKSRLDELPQLWNVLRGDMLFVGPRPERPEFVNWLSEEIPYYGLRHVVRPGITGWAQVRYRYGNTVDDAREKLKYDLFYIKHVSLGLDLWIMFETIKTVLLRRGAQ
ncbi:MAG: TIGR03013 family XrtA/PEP-CTERM system glycosyltransferase [Terriglobales bacterium]